MEDKELMSDNDEFRRVAEIERAANGRPSYLEMDAAFRARLHAAIAMGLESTPIGVITTKPRYVSEVTARYHRLRDER